MEEDLVTTNPLDAPPLDELRDAFSLPAPYADDERVLRWHTEIVTRLRREAAGVPMTTAQTMLMERIAFFYAVMRYKEFSGESVSLRELKDMNAAFLSMLDSFNKLLEKHNDKILQDVIFQVQTILKEALPIITDPAERTKLRQRLQNDFASIDL